MVVLYDSNIANRDQICHLYLAGDRKSPDFYLNDLASKRTLGFIFVNKDGYNATSDFNQLLAT
jgi:hypothetical protein